jgi:thioredoxin reductase (NADPH)
MRVINPTFGQPTSGHDQAASRPPDWRRDPICMFSNSKPNANELLLGISSRLEKMLGRKEIAFESKQNAAMPAGPELLDWLARQYRVVVLAVGD